MAGHALDRVARWVSSPLLVAVLVACAASPGAGGSPSPAVNGISVALLSGDGPRSTGPPNLMAARSVAELKALLHGLNNVRFHDPDSWDAFASRHDQVFISLAGGFCRDLQSVSAAWAGDGTVVIDYTSESLCNNGAGTAATPGLFLASIARVQLGSSVVTFQLKGGFGRAQVDLRMPASNEESAIVASDVVQAVTAARAQISPDTRARVLELDRMRWPDVSLACGPTPASLDALPVLGYIVVVTKGVGPNVQSEEFHSSAGRVVDCGPALGVLGPPLSAQGIGASNV